MQLAKTRADRAHTWLGRLVARRHHNIAAVAMANKNARLAWALLSTARPMHPCMRRQQRRSARTWTLHKDSLTGCYGNRSLKSLTSNWFGRSARNCRVTRSSGHGALASQTVVHTTLPRITLRRPSVRINRSNVQRATATPSRASCRQTFSAPVDLHVGLPDALNLWHQSIVATSPGAAPAGLAQQRCMASMR